MAKELADKLSQDEIEYQRYLAREKAIMDEISKREYNKMQLDEMKKIEQQALEAEEKAKESEHKALESEQKALEAKAKLEKENKKLQQDFEENLKNNIRLLKEFGIVDEDVISKKLNIPIERIRALNE